MARKLSDFDAALRHQYRVEPGGETVPGVTTAINVVEKPALVWSAAKIAAETALTEHRRKATIVRRHRKTLTALGKKERELAYNGSDDEVFVHYCRGEHRRQWDAKAARGTRVHEVAEKWTINPGEPVEVLKEDEGYINALEAFYNDCQPKFLKAELVVLNEMYRFGGRFDAVVEIGDQRYMLDYKTGSHYPGPLAMQQVAYMNCGVAAYDDEGNLTGISRAIHKEFSLDGARGLYLKEDGTYELIDPFSTIPQGVAWTAFLNCLATFRSMQDITRLERNHNDN